VSTSHRSDVVIVAPGFGRRVGNVEFLALSEDTPRFNFALITIAPHKHGPPEHVHTDEDDAFFILDDEMTFLLGEDEVAAPAGTFVLVPPGVLHTFANRTDHPVRMLNIHAPAGFDRRLLEDE
jgi:mannose-6-phosphate isomerase-like protein (cupin superfamily)